MQTVSSSLQVELDKGQFEPRILVDLYEFYDHDAVPGATGFDPADALELFAAEEITWNGLAYRREIRGDGQGRSDIVKAKGEKLNTVTINFSNISRYMATWAQTQNVEGMIVVIRCVSPSVTDDSIVLFTGKAGKPSDIDKEAFTLSCEQYFGDINVIVPPRRFENSDPEGRLPSDPLYEGIDLVAIAGSVTFPQIVPTDSRIGRLFGRRRVTYRTEQWSSTDATPMNTVVPEHFGRVQVKLIDLANADKGSHVGYLKVVGNGRLDAVTQLRSRTRGMSDPICNFANPPAPGVVHLGDPGGTGTNNGNTCQADLAGGRFFSGLSYIEGASAGVDANGNIVALGLDVADSVPDITALVRGKRVPLPNASGVYGAAAWTDNPVHITRFALTDPKWLNINPAFMEDAVNYRTSLHCDEPIVDNSGSQVIVIPGPDIVLAGDVLTRFLPTGFIRPRLILFDDFGDFSIIPQLEDGPYIGIDIGDPAPDPSDPSDPTYSAQKPLIKRYTANFPLTEEMKGTDFLHKILLPTFKGYTRTNKHGKIEILSEQPSDATRLRTSITVGATSIPVLNIEPWKTGLELMKGMVRLGALDSTDSEARKPSAAVYSTSGNSVALTAGQTGSVTATASGATLSGGSTSTPATGTITISGTPAAGNTVTATIDGIAVQYVIESGETTGTVAAMLRHHINANQRLNKYIRASWDSGTPTIVTLTCLHGALTVPALLKAHTTSIADPSAAPVTGVAVGGSMPAGTYLLAYADVNANGSTFLSPRASITLDGTQQIGVASLPALTGTSRDFYLSEKANSENLRYLTSNSGASFLINSVPANGAALPPSHNTTAEELLRVAMSLATNSQDVFPVWSGSTVVILNDVYLPTVLNGHKYQVTTAGTTASSEPSWPIGAGATVASGSVVFTEIGSTVLAQAGLTRANIRKATYKWPLGSKQSSVNQIKGTYRSAKDDFALTPFIINDPVHQALVKKKYPLEVDLPAVDNFNQMSRLANFHLSLNREGDWFNSLGTGPQGLVLEEGDLICSSDDSGGLVNVTTRIEELRIKPNHDVDIVLARKYSTLMFSDDVGSHRISLPSTLRFTATKPSLAEFIDRPAIRDSDAIVPGFFISVTHDLDVQGDWRGWALYADFGDGYTFLTEGDVPATMGTATTILGTASDIEVLDTVNDVTFTLDYSDPTPGFSSVTEADLVANPYRNLFLVGNEYVQAATVVDNGSRSYTISDLFHGRFNTDSDEMVHGAGERVIYINGAEKFVPMDVSRLNIPFNYKVVTTNQDVAEATPVSFTWLANNLKAKRPLSITGTFDLTADGACLIDWVDDTELPPTATAAYDLELRDGPSSSDATIRGPIEIKPIDLSRISGTPPLLALQPTGSFLPLANYDYVEPGGFDAEYTGTQWDDGLISLVESESTFSIRGGFMLEVQVSDQEPLDGNLFPSLVGIVPAVGSPTLTNSAAWTKHASINPDVIVPLGAPIGKVRHMTRNDRFTIQVSPDGTISYFQNYHGASSDPWYISPSTLDPAVIYKLQFRNDPYSTGGSSHVLRVRNTRWLRNMPEFIYTGAMQRADNSGSLPSAVYARIRKRSEHPLGPPSNWLYGSFVRP